MRYKLIFILAIAAMFIQNTLSAQETSAADLPSSRIVEDGGTGKYKAIMLSDESLPTHTIFRPEDLSAFGKKNKLPLITWGNGACVNSPGWHMNFLNEVASHGFLVIAIGPMPQEGVEAEGKSTSSQLTDAIDWAIKQNSDKKSPYYNKIDVENIAVSGMSCGGLQALEMAADPRFTVTLICNSGVLADKVEGFPGMPNVEKDDLKKLHTPTLYILGGESDIAYNNGMDDYKRIENVPVFMANMEVGHGGTYSQPHGGEFAKVATAWFLWQMKGNDEASKMFVGDDCGLCTDPKWKFECKNQ